MDSSASGLIIQPNERVPQSSLSEKKSQCIPLVFKLLALLSVVLFTSALIAQVTYNHTHSFTYSGLAGGGITLLGTSILGGVFYCIYRKLQEEEEVSVKTRVNVDLPFLTQLGENIKTFSSSKAYTYWDPNIDREIPFVEVARRALMYPALAKKQDVLVNLFVKALNDHVKCELIKNTSFDAKKSIYPYLKYFDQELLRTIIDRVIEGNFEHKLLETCSKLDVVLKSSETKDPIFQKTLPLTNAIKNVLENQNPDKLVCVGTALEGGFSFYHAVSQSLTLLLQKNVTMADLGKAMLQLIKTLEEKPDNKNWVKQLIISGVESEAAYHGYPTYEAYKEHLTRLASCEIMSETRGSYLISGRLISEIYEVEVNVISAFFSHEGEKENDNLKDLSKIKLKPSSISTKDSYERSIELALGLRHYVPIFILNES